jgi:glutamine amidotransferase
MKPSIAIVDYGVGNIFSVAKAFEYFKVKVKLVSFPDEIQEADALVLPGVGAFANGMQGLESRELIDSIKYFAASGKPLLGICLGMQMLFSRSLEFGEHQGLDLIAGDIVAIEGLNRLGQQLKTPHIGWNYLFNPSNANNWNESILKFIKPMDAVYFVHSFSAIPRDSSQRLADCGYGNLNINAVVAHDNIFGCQFHPEKSGQVGLNIIKGFLSQMTQGFF